MEPFPWTGFMDLQGSSVAFSFCDQRMRILDEHDGEIRLMQACRVLLMKAIARRKKYAKGDGIEKKSSPSFQELD